MCDVVSVVLTMVGMLAWYLARFLLLWADGAGLVLIRLSKASRVRLMVRKLLVDVLRLRLSLGKLYFFTSEDDVLHKLPILICSENS